MTKSSLVIEVCHQATPGENGLGKYTMGSACKGRITFGYLIVLAISMQETCGNDELLFQIVENPLEMKLQHH